MCQRRQKSAIFSAAYGRLKFGGSLIPSSSAEPMRDIGVARKIVVNLQRVGVNGDQHLGAAIQIRNIEHAVDQVRAEEIRDHQLLDQSHADQEQRAAPRWRQSRILGFSN